MDDGAKQLEVRHYLISCDLCVCCTNQSILIRAVVSTLHSSRSRCEEINYFYFSKSFEKKLYDYGLNSNNLLL